MKRDLKKLVGNYIPNILKEFIKNKPIINYYNTSFQNRALLSYMTYPFKKKNISFTHTNNFEVFSWANILNELGYQVDIIPYNTVPKNIKLEKYDLICGFAEVFIKYFNTPYSNAITIFYGTGMENCFQNKMTLERIKNVYQKKGVWLGESSRFVKQFYTATTIICDAVVALGNDECAKSYQKLNSNVYQLDAPFYKVLDYKKIIFNKKPDSKEHFLWFGSVGAVHKGLDLLLDYFSKRSDVYLHVCGRVENEKEFCKIYKKELFNTKNIKYHGFVDIKSKKFEEILKQCAFVIFPSCSEGGAPSVLTCIGNGGLIPIITKETTIDTGYDIWIEDFTEDAIHNAVEKALTYKMKDIQEISNKLGCYVVNKHAQERYYTNLKNIIINILTKKGVKNARNI